MYAVSLNKAGMQPVQWFSVQYDCLKHHPTNACRRYPWRPEKLATSSGHDSHRGCACVFAACRRELSQIALKPKAGIATVNAYSLW
jgi:maltooligosyltrehalose synthase